MAEESTEGTVEGDCSLQVEREDQRSVQYIALKETAYRSGFVDSFSNTSGSRCDRSAPSELIACEGDENQPFSAFCDQARGSHARDPAERDRLQSSFS